MSSSSPRSEPPMRRRQQTQQGPQLTPDMVLEMVLDFFRQRGLYAIPLGLLLGGAACYFVFTMLPPTFKAVAKVQVTAPPYSQLTEFKNGQMAFITTPNVLNAALDEPEARALPFVQQTPNAAAALGSMLKLDTLLNSPVIDIAVEGGDPHEVQVLTNAVLAAYLEKASTTINKNTAEEIGKIQDKVRQLETERTVLEGRKRHHARSVGSEDPTAVQRELLEVEERLATVRDRLGKVEEEYKAKEAEYRALARKEPTLTAQDLMLLWTQNKAGDPQQIQKMNALENLAARIAATSKKGWDDPNAIAATQQANGIRRAIEQGNPDLSRQLLQKRAQELEAEKEQLLRNLDAIVQQYTNLQNEQQTATERRRQLETVVSEIRQIDAQVVQLNRDIEKLADRLRSEELNYMSRYLTPLSNASLPDKPSLSSKKMLVLGAAFAGPFGFVLAVFALTYFRRRVITRAEHAKAMLPVPVLGVLPQVPTGIRLPSDEDFLPGSRHVNKWIAMQEAINSLRITLTFGADHRGVGLNTLMVTSARDSEGKSTLSAQLAVSLARSGVRVILIEADLYRPTQYETFGVSREPGLTEVLTGTHKLDEVIVETSYPGLDLLTAGSESNDIARLLTANKLQEIIEALRETYETILIDSPPVLPVSDALILGQVVDEAIVAVMCNHSQVHNVTQTCQRLESVGVQVRGCVVTGAPPMPKYYDAYYSKYKYSPYTTGGGSQEAARKPYRGGLTNDRPREAAAAAPVADVPVRAHLAATDDALADTDDNPLAGPEAVDPNHTADIKRVAQR